MGILNLAGKLKQAEKFFDQLKPIVEQLKERADAAGDPAHLIQLVDKFESDARAAKEFLQDNDNPADDIFIPLLQGLETTTSLFGDEARVIAARFGVELPPERPATRVTLKKEPEPEKKEE